MQYPSKLQVNSSVLDQFPSWSGMEKNRVAKLISTIREVQGGNHHPWLQALLQNNNDKKKLHGICTETGR